MGFVSIFQVLQYRFTAIFANVLVQRDDQLFQCSLLLKNRKSMLNISNCIRFTATLYSRGNRLLLIFEVALQSALDDFLPFGALTLNRLEVRCFLCCCLQIQDFSRHMPRMSRNGKRFARRLIAAIRSISRIIWYLGNGRLWRW